MKRRSAQTIGSFVAAVALSGLPSAVLAVDGVLEVSHVCAVNTGCFSGDSAGYPVTIDGSAGRSYRLTTDLVVPDENTSGIEVVSPSVTIDLNGFEIVRSGCVGATNPCTPGSGSGSGIRTPIQTYRGISVRNGSVTGMGERGVFLGHQGEVSNVRVRWNRVYGIYVGNGSTVSGSTSYANGADGIYAPASTVSGNTAYLNGGVGINTSGVGSTVVGNTAWANTLDGFYTAASTVADNTSYLNGGDGIEGIDGSTVRGNTVRNNTGFGLNLSADSAYLQSTVTGNTAGTVNGGIDLGSNSCNAAAACP